MTKIALAQINSGVGDLKNNRLKIIEAIGAARKNRADMVVFGELALTGYPPQDLLFRRSFIDRNLSCLKEIKKYSRGITSLVGFVDRRKGKIYNACALIDDARIIDVYHKVMLPNYGVFDEKRYFSPGTEVCVYDWCGYRFCVTICEDIWDKSFSQNLTGRKIDFVVNLSASPFHLGKVSLRRRVLARCARGLGAAVFYVNLAGGQDEIVFDGRSMVVSPHGRVVSSGAAFREDISYFDFSRKRHWPAHKMAIPEDEQVYRALCLGLKDYVGKNGFKRVVLGVSGGIDSAVVAALSAASLGRDNVTALIMPSPYTSSQTLRDAKRLCSNLGIDYYVIHIDKLFSAFRSALRPVFGRGGGGITEENIQARIRGNLLMAFSNKFDALVLNTGNKSEVSCGYCTLYGDMVGGFGVLKDITKARVYRLARYINAQEEKHVIPVSIIKRAPSAELRPRQKDSDSLPPYELLDPILEFYVERNMSCEAIVKRGFPRRLVRRVAELVDGSEYKRFQAAPGVKITQRAFGRDRRMPLANGFRE